MGRWFAVTKKVIHIISDIAFLVVIVSVIIGSFLFAIDKNPEKDIFGFRVYNVVSASMEPEISKGDLVVVKVKSGTEVQSGDVVTYYPIGDNVTTVTHRVINTMMKDGQVYIQTKGDAVDTADPLITADDIVGVVVFHIPFVGAIINWIQGHIAISLGGVMAVLVVYIIVCLVKRKNKGIDA